MPDSESESESTNAPSSSPELLPPSSAEDSGWAQPDGTVRSEQDHAGAESETVAQSATVQASVALAVTVAVAQPDPTTPSISIEPPLGTVPATQKPKRKRVLWITAVVVVLALVSVGVVALTSGRSGNSVVAMVHCQPSKLTTCLIKAPAGAEQLSGSSPWDQDTAPTTDLYSSNITRDAAGVSDDTSSFTTTDGLQHLAHADWNAVDGNNVDLVLLQFASQKGARAWNATRTAEIAAAYPGQSVTIPGDTAAKAFAATKADKQGNIDAAYSTVVGNLVLNVAYSSPMKLSAADLETWAGTELASLRTAPAAPADQPDVAPGGEQLACGQLTSCLMPMPSGAERWTSPTDSHWVAGSTLTSSQFIQLSYDSKADTQTQVSSNFSSDGVSAIAHEDWDTDGGNKQADIYLIQTITATGANELSGKNFGDPEWNPGQSGVSYTIPNEPGAQAWYANKPDSNGFIGFYFTQAIGNVIVNGWLYFSGSFDSGTANSWTQSELNLINHTASSQPMGLFPLNAPTLPAFSQGTCPASGDCLLPLPGGATDTTASSFHADKSVDDYSYASQYESATSTDTAKWMDSDGFKSAEHRSWTAADGATADAVLLKYGNPAEAKAAAQLEYGINVSNDRDCTDAAVLPDSQCVAAPVSVADLLQKETIWVLAWKGDYEVSIAVTRSNAADVAEAYAWAQQQLELLSAATS
jgi:hypothetical protein